MGGGIEDEGDHKDSPHVAISYHIFQYIRFQYSILDGAKHLTKSGQILYDALAEAGQDVTSWDNI